MVVGVCRVTMMVPESHSLKEKRMVLRRIKDRVQNKFNCAIAEVGDQDNWQSAKHGFCAVYNQLGFPQAIVQQIPQFIEDLTVCKITNDEQDYINYGDEGLEAGDKHWE